ncbi:hypothetical protein VitviT2T_007854 [Vitis vinifera]|uniref:Uncharacterized protein n=1 Tax=Vitis vinifera TaxID=29760 RepID=A0ABY9C039_VITVI|nr:uncharacterized protein LOC100248335 [Vitis vinifera]WJZ88572.1 hypothetical protein VitviT2T_007854 [Vitis vinifera]|eukprot:XP_010651263.1 PREDICTED: uncharacterized protein LOC100248335 [Vitis vinifera]
MEEDDFGLAPTAPAPALVSLLPFSPSVSPSPRRLSSNFTQPSRPVRAARQLAWVDLRGRLVGAEECSSARAIGSGLRREEAVAWELFSPIHRILIVAVIAVAATESKKNHRIMQLNKSVQTRDQVLLSMQQKLDSLCEQVNSIKDQPDMLLIKNVLLPSSEVFASDKLKLVGCGCRLCDQHLGLSNDLMDNLVSKTSSEDEIFKYKMEAEQEERRMSDLSWISSVTSSIEIQSTSEQDICNLKRQCEERDATIKELSAFVHSSNIAGSKRISELEDIIRRKNSTIIKLKKDLVTLEQKVVQLSRLRRPSFSATSPKSRQIPLLADNLLYDMDSTTSPSSSSDSDCAPENSRQPPVAKIQEIPAHNSDFVSRRIQKSARAKTSGSLVMPTDWHTKSRPSSPLQEKMMNQTSDAVSSFKPKQLLPPNGGVTKSRRRAQIRSNDVVPQKKWV